MLTFTQEDLRRAEEEARKQQEEARKQQELARLHEERVKIIRLAVESLGEITKQMQEIALPEQTPEPVRNHVGTLDPARAMSSGDSDDDDEEEDDGGRPTIRISSPSKPLRKRNQAATATVPAEKTDGRRRRGRPSNDEIGGIKQPPLEDVIMSIVQRHKRGLGLDELLTKVRQSGYLSTSLNFRNMVQQAVNRLMQKEKLIKDEESMKYKAAAA